MLRLVNPYRHLPNENVRDYMNHFPILCAENAAAISSDDSFLKQLLLETAILTDDNDVIDRLHAIQEGAVASIVDSIGAFIKNIIDFFKKLVDRLTTSFAANAESIDKWIEKVKDRLAANKKNAPKFEYEGYKWNPTRLEKFRVDIDMQLPVPVAEFSKNIKKEADDFKQAIDTKTAQAKGRLVDEEKYKKEKEAIKDSELSHKDKGVAKDQIKDKFNNDNKLAKNADELIKKLDVDGKALKAKAGDAPLETITKDDNEEVYKEVRVKICDELFNNDDEGKGMDEVKKEIFGGEEKLTIKGFSNISLDGMLNIIKNYKKVSELYAASYSKLIDEYNKVEAVLNSIGFDNSKASEDTKDKTTNFTDARRGSLTAALSQLRWAQNLLNTCSKNAMTWHKEMVNDFMKTITTFAMTNFN